MVALIGAGIAATGAVAGAAINSAGAQSAAKTAADANRQAAALADARYQTTRGDLQPYNKAGQDALGQYQPLYDETKSNLDNAYNNAQDSIPKNFTQAELLNNPGYQFQVQQGQQALSNSLAGQGKSGVSGTRMKAALNFGTGLAQSNWQQLFNNKQKTFEDLSSQFSNRFNQGNSLFSQLSGRSTLGENAAAQTGAQGTALANTAASNIAKAGENLAGGQLASAQDIAKGLNGVGYLANNYLQSPAGKAALGGSDSSSYNPSNYGYTAAAGAGSGDTSIKFPTGGSPLPYT